LFFCVSTGIGNGKRWKGAKRIALQNCRIARWHIIIEKSQFGYILEGLGKVAWSGHPDTLPTWIQLFFPLNIWSKQFALIDSRNIRGFIGRRFKSKRFDCVELTKTVNFFVEKKILKKTFESFDWFVSVCLQKRIL
jgi:hypothetical protein